MTRGRANRRRRYETPPMTDASLSSGRARPRTSRRLVVISVILYCALAWAAVYKAVDFGVSMARHSGDSFAKASTSEND
jgi:hypothetical protein